MKRIDLHVHTTASDGTFTPSEAVAHARSLGLAAMAVTDHDTAEGVPEALAAGAALGVEVIPGIEVSVDWRGRGVHVLGYFIDPAAPSLQKLLDWVNAERRRRNECIAAATRADGLAVTRPALEAEFPSAVLGRPHFAAALVRLGRADSIPDAFARWLNRDRPYFRKREYIPLAEAFEVIRAAGGKAVMAHPLQYKLPEDELLALISQLRDAGAVGMECRYAAYDAAEQAYLERLAAHFRLTVTGGSDFHGTRRPVEMGAPDIPYALLAALKTR